MFEFNRNRNWPRRVLIQQTQQLDKRTLSLHISPSSVRKIKNRFTELSVWIERGWKPTLNSDRQALRQGCINKTYLLLQWKSLWGLRNTSEEPLSVNTVCSCIHKCKLKLLPYKERKGKKKIQRRSCLLWAKAHIKVKLRYFEVCYIKT